MLMSDKRARVCVYLCVCSVCVSVCAVLSLPMELADAICRMLVLYKGAGSEEVHIS